MKTLPDHIVPKTVGPNPADGLDLHAPIYSGEEGFITEAEKQALVASAHKSAADYKEGKWLEADAVFDRLLARARLQT